RPCTPVVRAVITHSARPGRGIPARARGSVRTTAVNSVSRATSVASTAALRSIRYTWIPVTAATVPVAPRVAARHRAAASQGARAATNTTTAAAPVTTAPTQEIQGGSTGHTSAVSQEATAGANKRRSKGRVVPGASIPSQVVNAAVHSSRNGQRGHTDKAPMRASKRMVRPPPDEAGQVGGRVLKE